MVTIFVDTENQHFDCFYWQNVAFNLFQKTLAMTGAMTCNFCHCSHSSMIVFYSLQYGCLLRPAWLMKF